jgi:ProP effector
MQRAEPPAALPVDPAQRERAMLLRSYESSPLSKANFCALKGLTEAAFDAALAQAQAERGTSPNAAARRGGSAR